ncbi:MAG: hypothetical protein ACJA09_001772 [Alcanivorax sp.]|jgi:hypothetical protein
MNHPDLCCSCGESSRRLLARLTNDREKPDIRGHRRNDFSNVLCRRVEFKGESGFHDGVRVILLQTYWVALHGRAENDA